MYVKVKELPTVVQQALASLGYGKADIETRAGSTVTLSSASGNGSRAFATVINLTAGQFQTTWGSWGGANMFNKDNAVDNDDRPYPLPADGIAITGSKGGGRPVYATLLIPATMVDRILPAAGEPLTPEENDALYCHQCVKGGEYRRDEMRRRGVSPATVDALVTRGLLKRNKAGAVSITTEGKNTFTR